MSMNPPCISIGHLSTIYHTSFILMGTDWLHRAGIDVRWNLYASGPDIVNAFTRKEIDIGYIGLPPTMIGIDRSVPIICVAGGHVEGTVLIARNEYQSLDKLTELSAVLAQFEGKVIGSPPKGSIHDVIINHALKESKLAGVQVKNFAWTDFVLEALVDGEIDAAVGTPPLAVAAARACGANILIPPHALWPNNPSYGIVIRKELIEYPEVVETFLELHEKASNFIRKDPQMSAGMVAKLTGIVDQDFVMDAYRVSPKYCAALSCEFVKSTLAFVPVLSRLGYISRSLYEDEIFEYRFIHNVHKGEPHYDLTVL